MLIRDIAMKDAAEWEAMRCELWPDGDDHAAEIAAFFAGTLAEPEAVLVAEDGGLLIGFAELSVRRDVAGLEGKFTGYVEGLFVRPAFRGRGVALQLLRVSQEWARGRRCVAVASDRGGRVIVDRRFGANIE
jgi:aminoglycoside 6'-N-acetyltransferase I